MQIDSAASFVEYKGTDNGFKTFELRKDMMDEEECHMIFPTFPCEELVVATHIEHFFFHPDTPAREKFKIDLLSVGGVIPLTYAHFPLEFKAACQKVASLYALTMKETSRHIIDPANKVIFHMPASQNLLIFEGVRNQNHEEILRECERAKWVGDALEKLGVD
jgi:hypothetical protein